MALTAPFALTLLLYVCLSSAASSPHHPVKQTWVIFNPVTGTTANSTSSSSWPAGTWFPDLFVDLCDIVGKDWDPSPQEPFPGYGCGSPGQRSATRQLPFYICPGFDKRDDCGGPADGYCAAWGCETTGSAYWLTSSSDLISVHPWDRSSAGTGRCLKNNKYVDCGPCYDKSKYPYTPLAHPRGLCNSLHISFTNKGKAASDWENGRTWGLRLYKSGYDPVSLFSIQLRIQPLTVPVGPNVILADQRGPSLPRPQPPPPPTQPASPPV